MTMNIGPAWPPIAGSSELQCHRWFVVRQLDDVLHAAFAKAALTHDDGPIVVLERGRDNFTGAGGISVDEYSHGTRAGRLHQCAARFGLIGLLMTLPVANADDLARVEEYVADFHRGREQPARIVAQIEDQSAAVLIPLQLFDHFTKIGRRMLAEGNQADVGNA